MSNTLGEIFSKELEAEAKATRACLERISEKTFSWKPHEKSMLMENLCVVISDIPNWVSYAIKDGEVNFQTYPHFKPATGADLAQHFDEALANAQRALANVSDEALEKTFRLKNGDQLLMEDSVRNTISSSINHLVHHRGQLTVYMRLNDIPVPSIYGPSADDPTF